MLVTDDNDSNADKRWQIQDKLNAGTDTFVVRLAHAKHLCPSQGLLDSNFVVCCNVHTEGFEGKPSPLEDAHDNYLCTKVRLSLNLQLPHLPPQKLLCRHQRQTHPVSQVINLQTRLGPWQRAPLQPVR